MCVFLLRAVHVQADMMDPLETVALARSGVADAVQVQQVTDEEDARQMDNVAQEAQDAEVGSAMLQQADMDDESAFERDIAPLRERADVAAIVHGMNKHAGHHAVQEEGCGALANLAANNADHTVRIAKQGGIEAIVKALEIHRGIAAVQGQGCRALWYLSCDNADNKERTYEAGAKGLIRQAMAATNATAKTKEYGEKLVGKFSGILKSQKWWR